MPSFHQLNHILELAREVRARTGKSVLGQLAEMLQLRLGDGRLGSSEYYDFQLWDDDRFPMPRKTEFLGLRGQAVVEEILIDDYSMFLSLDKLTFYALMRAHGMPVPR